MNSFALLRPDDDVLDRAARFDDEDSILGATFSLTSTGCYNRQVVSKTSKGEGDLLPRSKRNIFPSKTPVTVLAELKELVPDAVGKVELAALIS